MAVSPSCRPSCFPSPSWLLPPLGLLCQQAAHLRSLSRISPASKGQSAAQTPTTNPERQQGHGDPPRLGSRPAARRCPDVGRVLETFRIENTQAPCLQRGSRVGCDAAPAQSGSAPNGRSSCPTRSSALPPSTADSTSQPSTVRTGQASNSWQVDARTTRPCPRLVGGPDDNEAAVTLSILQYATDD